MRIRKFSVVLLGISAAAIGLALWLFSTSPAAQARRDADRTLAAAREQGPAAPASPALTVDGFVVEVAPETAVIDIAGVLEPVRSVVVGAEVPGRVVSLEVEEFTPVESGQVLMRLDSALPRAAVEKARAALVQAEAANDLSQTELRRQRDLQKRGVTSAAELDRTRSEARGGAAQVAAARAVLNDAETRLAKTEITAPFSGFVSQLDLHPGAYLQPGEPVLELSDLSEVEIQIGVGDDEILALRDGGRAEVRVQVLPGESFEGRITRLGRTVDRKTRKYAVPVRIANSERRLLPGMLGTVRFELGSSHNGSQIPSRAVQREFDLAYVFVLVPVEGEPNVALVERRRVDARPVAFRPNLLDVGVGLQPGEQVAVSRVKELRSGQRVRVRERAVSVPAGALGS